MTDVSRTEPIWLDSTDALAIHDRQLAEHGGGTGVRDMTMLESALGRPVNRWHYGTNDVAELAAAYAFGVARNHPFIDGNKRTSWVLARLFLAINGHKITFDKEDAVRTVLALASGDLSEDELADWFRTRLVQ
jgi:death on curing protein